ncbi:hypothetical protein DS901_03465 [Loktanella sp. D2R18]|uniref:hypothetical protein n=1 Tax=Rhodobacterales TaxID=204455 RepID=UPI000DEA92C1|nr:MULTISPECIES: hypothetical protein [Rhodobacterales]MDO6589283.1 hypothetical protein [Yoonia sp. 1_MG-2023]RBW45294.1 hypothetical protein DS901_03465 [Loktanella sp. D2R18]
MTIKLRMLSGAGSSLEFDPDDTNQVRGAIHDCYGKPWDHQNITHIDFKFGGADFIFLDEWDAPCLIASTQEGTNILQALYKGLGD